MESSIQTFRRNAAQHLKDKELDKARILVAAILGIVSTDRAEFSFVRNSLANLFTADAEKIGSLLRISYDKASRIEMRRRNEQSDKRPRFF
jgi:hypothetical protein